MYDNMIRQLLTFTNQNEDTFPQAEQAAIVIAGMVDSYCRGHARYASGQWKPGVEQVIIAASARLLANTGQTGFKEQSGAYSVSRGAGFQGFTLAEQKVLNRYRRRAR